MLYIQLASTQVAPHFDVLHLCLTLSFPTEMGNLNKQYIKLRNCCGIFGGSGILAGTSLL